MDVVFDNLDLYWKGLSTTIVLSVLSFTAALAIGTMVATCRVSPIPPLRMVASVYTEAFRNTPLTVQLILFYFGLTKVGIQYSAFTSAVIVLTIYTSAFIAETVRSGVNSVAGGQAEAARSLGLGFMQTLVLIVLPQALRSVVAPLGGLFIALCRNSSIASIIGVMELTYVTDGLANDTARGLQVFAGTMVAYLLLTYPAGLLVGVLERRVAIKR